MPGFAIAQATFSRGLYQLVDSRHTLVLLRQAGLAMVGPSAIPGKHMTRNQQRGVTIPQVYREQL